jgi:HD-GYP domain-containing protein (c-di-GMP phosphodiesterase class II)
MDGIGIQSASVAPVEIGVNGCNMNTVTLQDLKVKAFYSRPLFLDEGFILLAPETPVDEGLIKRLTRWEFRQTFTAGKQVEAAAIDEAPESKTADGAKPMFADGTGDKERLEGLVAYYAEYSSYIETLYTRFVTKTELDYIELIERMKSLHAVVTQNRRFLLRAQASVVSTKNYLVSHAVRSSIFSMILGVTLKQPPFRLIELGAAAVLHEIGMIRLPPQLYMAGRKLSPQERKSITAHPVLGFNLLKERQLPLAVCLAALEHHERVNGSGYPRGLSGDKISLYARIIMVACSYDAVTAARPYKEAKDGYSGMVDILKNEGKQYDDIIIRALVYSLSIYPIGTHVMLTNGKSSIVVDIKELVIRTTETSVRVLRPLTKEEIEHSKAV